MPEQLFPGVGTITVAVVMRAHTPHDEDKEVWFGYCRNDGFRLSKNQRHDTGSWNEIEKLWIDSFKNRKIIKADSNKHGFESLTAKINADSEWIGEAFMEIDYSKIQPDDFFTFFKKYKLFKLENESLGYQENQDSEDINEDN